MGGGALACWEKKFVLTNGELKNRKIMPRFAGTLKVNMIAI